jgi:hypothetical protein
MTETSILPGAEPAAESGHEAPPPVAGTEETEGSGANRRILMIAGAVGAVIILAAAAYLLLHKSSSSTPALVPPASTGSTAPAPHAVTVHKKTVKTKTVHLPKVQKHPTVRNPFIPLVVAPDASEAAPASTTTVTGSSTTTTTNPATSTTGSSTSTTAPTVTTHVIGIGSPQTIQLVTTGGTTATFDVAYNHNVVRQFVVTSTSGSGTEFAKVFTLTKINGSHVTIVIGDGSPITLQPGVVHAV